MTKRQSSPRTPGAASGKGAAFFVEMPCERVAPQSRSIAGQDFDDPKKIYVASHNDYAKLVPGHAVNHAYTKLGAW